MNGKNKILLVWAVILLWAGCGGGNGDAVRTEPPAEIRATPDPVAETLNRYREKGIEPRRARFARELEE